MPFIQIYHRPALRPLFPTPQLGYMMGAISAGNSPGLIWLDDEKTPASAFIWDKTHSLYFGGEADNSQFNHSLRHLLVDTLLPEAEERRLRILKFYTASDAWASQIPALVEPLSLETRGRTLFMVESSTSNIQPKEPAGFHLRQIDRELLSEAANAHYVIEEIESCWTSMERFLANGFGVAALTDSNEIACWCTAEYVCGSTCGAGIETLEPYQNRGLATAAAQSFVHHALQQSRTVYWDSWQSNLPSVKVAEKVGFQKVADYTVQLARLD